MAWTRVKELEQAIQDRVQVFDVEADLLTNKSLKQVQKGAIRDLGKILFDPEEFKDVNYNFSVDNHRLDEEELYNYAKMASSLRRNISQQVGLADEEVKDQLSEIEAG